MDAAHRATNYLLSREARPMEATFWHRKNPEKDTCNGLIGQAWTIEALVTAARVLEREEPLVLAEEVFLEHPFREKIALWRRVAVDGQYLGLDPTLNHQIWFAAAGALLVPFVTEEVDRRVRSFLGQLNDHFRVRRSGLTRHTITPSFSWVKLAKYTAKRITQSSTERQALRRKELGYHAFNLYGLGVLYKQYSGHAFWTSPSFLRACRYVASDAFSQSIAGSPYGFPYNPPGFEVAFVFDAFGDILDGRTEERPQEWVVKQLAHCFDWSEYLMNRNTPDPVTHAARIYEATRLPDLELKMSDQPSVNAHLS